MSVIVVSGLVDNGSGVFQPGDIIIGLSDKDEQELVACGACRYLENGIQDELIEEGKPEIDDSGLVKLPGGLWQLPNGEQVRGKKKALEALAELKQYTEDNSIEEEESEDSEEQDDVPNTGIPGVEG